MILSNRELYIGKKLYYCNSWDKVHTFTIKEIREIREYTGKVLFCDEDRWRVVHVGEKGSYYGIFDYKREIIDLKNECLICDADCPKDLAKILQELANKEIDKQKKIIQEYQEKIKECWEIISKCNSKFLDF